MTSPGGIRPVGVIALAVLVLFFAAMASSAQPLTLGSSRDEVMGSIYSRGVQADTLREYSRRQIKQSRTPRQQSNSAPTDSLRFGSYITIEMMPVSRQGSSLDITVEPSRVFKQEIRLAPVMMFGLAGYGRYRFDRNGRLVSYRWTRGDIQVPAEDPEPMTTLDVATRVARETYDRARAAIDPRYPLSNWGDEPERNRASAMWQTETEVLELTWENGTLTFEHRPQD